MKSNITQWPVTEVPASGNKDWFDGAWVMGWVHSEKGNFLVKGFLKECREHVASLGVKAFVLWNLHSNHPTRRITDVFGMGNQVDIYHARRSRRSDSDVPKHRSWYVKTEKGRKFLKRLPKNWSTFEKLVQELRA